MNSSATRSKLRRASKASAPAGATVGMVVPFIKAGLLIQVTPRLTVKQAKLVISHLVGNWSNLWEQYRQNVASVDNLSGGKVLCANGEQQTFWHRIEGDTLVLDFPLLQAVNGQNQAVFDTRLCVAICTGKSNTKVWCRVGLPQGKITSVGIPTVKLRVILPLWRKVATKSCAWMSDILMKAMSEQARGAEVVQGSKIEVSVLGIRDKTFAKPFRRLSETRTPAVDLLKDKKVRARFSRYYNALSAAPIDIMQQLKAAVPAPWFSLPVMVIARSGYVESREVLYLNTASAGKAQVLGIGYDDSVHGKLSHDAVRKAIQWIGRLV